MLQNQNLITVIRAHTLPLPRNHTVIRAVTDFYETVMQIQVAVWTLRDCTQIETEAAREKVHSLFMQKHRRDYFTRNATGKPESGCIRKL